MVEVLFYQLDRRPLEAVLPQLLERTLERGWRACVQAGSEERVEALSSALWTWREEAFLPHGTARDGHGELQPIWLTAGDDNPNGASVRFLVDGAAIVTQRALLDTSYAPYVRVMRRVVADDVPDPRGIEGRRVGRRRVEVAPVDGGARMVEQDGGSRGPGAGDPDDVDPLPCPDHRGASAVSRAASSSTASTDARLFPSRSWGQRWRSTVAAPSRSAAAT